MKLNQMYIAHFKHNGNCALHKMYLKNKTKTENSNSMHDISFCFIGGFKESMFFSAVE